MAVNTPTSTSEGGRCTTGDVLTIARRLRRVLPSAEFEALRASVLGSGFVGSSTLNGPFEASRGFGVTFTDEGRGALARRFPALEPWLRRCLGAPAVAALTPWWRHRPSRVPNAWYLNLLVVGPGAEVARHIDGTLMGPAEVSDHPPECVSVLYLEVPFSRGGELVLWNGSIPVGLHAPAPNDAVHFRGDLAHAVRPFDGPPGARRASLVIEQYRFEPLALAKLPAFRLDSRAGFGAYLEDHATRPLPTFELER